MISLKQQAQSTRSGHPIRGDSRKVIAITDVQGVWVGQVRYLGRCALKLVRAVGTGVTAVLPRQDV